MAPCALVGRVPPALAANPRERDASSTGVEFTQRSPAPGREGGRHAPLGRASKNSQKREQSALLFGTELAPGGLWASGAVRDLAGRKSESSEKLFERARRAVREVGSLEIEPP